MVSVASQMIQEATAHAQSDSLEDAREICADGTYFPSNLRSTTRTISNGFYPKRFNLRPPMYSNTQSLEVLVEQ